MDGTISRNDRVARSRATIRKGGSRAVLVALTALLTLLMARWRHRRQAIGRYRVRSSSRKRVIRSTGCSWMSGVSGAAPRRSAIPITPELEEKGRTVQYYEYARFEYVPDDPSGKVVHFGEIGRELKPTHGFPLETVGFRVDEAQDGLTRIATSYARGRR